MSDVNQIIEYDLTISTKFQEAFSNGYNITEACHYAGVSRTTYYNWLKEYPEFAEKVEIAKNMPNRVAKEVVIKAINDGDANLAFKYLQARDPAFKAKAEVDINHGLRDTREKLKEFLDDTDDGAYNDAGEQPVTAIEPASTE